MQFSAKEPFFRTREKKNPQKPPNWYNVLHRVGCDVTFFFVTTWCSLPAIKHYFSKKNPNITNFPCHPNVTNSPSHLYVFSRHNALLSRKSALSWLPKRIAYIFTFNTRHSFPKKNPASTQSSRALSRPCFPAKTPCRCCTKKIWSMNTWKSLICIKELFIWNMSKDNATHDDKTLFSCQTSLGFSPPTKKPLPRSYLPERT